MAKVRERKRGRKPMALRLIGAQLAPTVSGGPDTVFKGTVKAPVKNARPEGYEFNAPKGSVIVPVEITDEALSSTSEANVREILRLAANDVGATLSIRSVTLEWEDKAAIAADCEPGILFYYRVRDEKVADKVADQPATKAPVKKPVARKATRK